MRGTHLQSWVIVETRYYTKRKDSDVWCGSGDTYYSEFPTVQLAREQAALLRSTVRDYYTGEVRNPTYSVWRADSRRVRSMILRILLS